MSISSYKLLQISAIATFVGRGFQYFFRDVPLRVVLWDEEFLSPILAMFGIAWQSYTTNPQTEQNILFFQKSIGIVFFLAAIFVFFQEKINNSLLKKTSKFIVIFGVLNLVFLAFCYSKDHFFHLGQFFEYAIQVGCCVAMLSPTLKGDGVMQIKLTTNFQFAVSLIFCLKILCALTFSCHGLYAMNVYTTPVEYISMMMNGFALEEKMAKNALLYIGIVDIVVSILIFFPKKIASAALYYMAFWGFLTCIGRIYGYYHEGLFLVVLEQYWFHALYRIGHFLVPAAVIKNQKYCKKQR